MFAFWSDLKRERDRIPSAGYHWLCEALLYGARRISECREPQFFFCRLLRVYNPLPLAIMVPVARYDGAH